MRDRSIRDLNNLIWDRSFGCSIKRSTNEITENCDRAGFEAGEGWNGKGRDRLLCGDGDCSLGYKELCQRLQGVI